MSDRYLYLLAALVIVLGLIAIYPALSNARDVMAELRL